VEPHSNSPQDIHKSTHKKSRHRYENLLLGGRSSGIFVPAQSFGWAGGMADEFDFDRVVSDPIYRRRVIARLNDRTGNEPPADRDTGQDRPALQTSPLQPGDER
jgi:hypothetical protein